MSIDFKEEALVLLKRARADLAGAAALLALSQKRMGYDMGEPEKADKAHTLANQIDHLIAKLERP